MKKTADSGNRDELRAEYNFRQMTGGVRGKHYEQARAGTNLVLLDPDVARAFPTAESVNEALRMLVKLAETSSGAARKKP